MPLHSRGLVCSPNPVRAHAITRNRPDPFSIMTEMVASGKYHELVRLRLALKDESVADFCDMKIWRCASTISVDM